MKRIAPGFLCLISCSLYFTITGCDKTGDVVPVINNTIAGQILKDTNYSLFESLVGKANLAITLEGPGPFTVFTPDDDAFAASGITQSTINGLTQAQAQRIVLYHTLNSKTLAADLPAGPNGQVATFNNDSLFVTKNANGIFVNGIKLIQADMPADNGVMHLAGRVILPSAGTVAETAILNRLDSLAKAISRATNDSTGDAGLKNILNTATITLFAPTDSAFISLLTDLSLTDINEIPVNTLVAALEYHLTSGRLFSNQLADGPLTMLSGVTAIIGLTAGAAGGPAITGNNNGGNASTILSKDVLFNNGLLYVIDRVLLP